MAIIELIAEGQQDVYITGKPSVTYFDAVYLRHTPFIVETHEVPFDTTPNLDDTAIATIPYKGDILSDITLRTIFPALYTAAQGVWCYPTLPSTFTTPIRVYILTNGILTTAIQCAALSFYWSTFNLAVWASNFTGYAIGVSYDSVNNKFVFSSSTITTFYFVDEASASFWGFDIRNPDVRFGLGYGYNISGGVRNAQLNMLLSGWIPGYSPPALGTYYDGVGTRVIRSATLLIGGQRISTITGDSIDLENDITVPYENQMALTALVGKNDLNYKLAPRYCFTRMNFGIDNIPIGALDRHDVQVEIEFEKQMSLLTDQNVDKNLVPTRYTLGNMRGALGFNSYGARKPYIYNDIIFWNEGYPNPTQRVFYDSTKSSSDPTAYRRVTRTGAEWGLPAMGYSYSISNDGQYLIRQPINDFINNLDTRVQSSVKYWGNFGYGDAWMGSIPGGESGSCQVQCTDGRYVYIRTTVNYIQASGRSIVMQSWATTSLVFKFYGATSIGATEYNNFATFWRTRESTISSMSYASQVTSGPDTLVTYNISTSSGSDPGLHYSGLLLRYDTLGNFNSASSYSFYSDYRSIWNGYYLGQYSMTNLIYQTWPTYDGYGTIITSIDEWLILININNFTSGAGWTRINRNALGSPAPSFAGTDSDNVLYVDGVWIYVKYNGTYLWRFNSQSNPALYSSWEYIPISSFPVKTIAQIVNNNNLAVLPFANDSRYIYYMMGSSGSNFGLMAYDKTKPFNQISSWTWTSKHNSYVVFPEDWESSPGTASGALGANDSTGYGFATSRIAVDASGNYYVTARVYSEADVPIYNQDGSLYGVVNPVAGEGSNQIMIKYGSDGFIKWICNIVRDMTVTNMRFDASGNMRLTLKGWFFYTLTGGSSFSPTGASNLQNIIRGYCGSLNTTTGVMTWAAAVTAECSEWTQGGSNSTGLAVDSSGNSYFCGTVGHNYQAHNINWYGAGSATPSKTISRPGGGWTGFISKLDPNGAFLWGAYMDSTSVSVWPSTITLDTTGNPIVCGAHTGSGGVLTVYNSTNTSFGTSTNPYTWTGFLAKYTTTGGGTSVTTYAPTSNTLQIDCATTDSSGNIFITGKEAVGSTYQCFLRKYNSSFAVQWTALQVSSTAGEMAGVTKIRLDSAGNVIMMGAFRSPTITLYNESGSVFKTFSNTPDNSNFVNFKDTFIVKYTNAGVGVWALKWGGERDDFPGGVDVDSSNNIYLYMFYRSTNFVITNTSGGFVNSLILSEYVGESLGGSNILLAKVTSAGELVWKNNMRVSFDSRFVTSTGVDFVGLDIPIASGWSPLKGSTYINFVQGDWYNDIPSGGGIMRFDTASLGFLFANASLLVEYAYLGENELTWFKKSRHNFLLEQKQLFKTTLPVGKTALPLTFVGPVTDLWVTAKTDSNANTYTYSNITSMALTLNSAEMFNYNGILFNLVTPFEVADTFPTRNVYMYRFGAPANFSRVRDKVLTVEVDRVVNVQVWARTFNVLVVQNGMGGLLFNSYT